MAGKDLFDKPFDDGTLDKLSIYKEYLKEWLPVFTSRSEPNWKVVQIFDFFAGKGKDVNGVPGSPLVAIDIINLFKHLAHKNGVKIVLHLNEIKSSKYQALLKNVEGMNDGFEIRVYKEEFQKLFEKLYLSMQNSANFLFLDQNGIKEISKNIFARITALQQTDFLFFISSSYFKRFAGSEEFKKYFPFTKEEVDTTDYFHMHRKVLDHYKSLIQTSKKYFLAPFSIRKGGNVFGLIFGTNHTLGIEKFLRVAWKKDTLRGEANFDIDSERIDLVRPKLFEEMNKPNKRQVFEKKLTDEILKKGLVVKYDIYLYALTEGFQLKDVNALLKNLKTEKRIDFDFKLISSDLHKLSGTESLKVL
jgi:three-Cys-motif partner protein